MSPLDDQLRAAMHARADVLSPSPDPLGGIESRARGLKRRRVAASVAGAALAVAAVAVVVPSLATGSSAPGRKAEQVATNGTTTADALDAAHPWAYRGKPLSAGTKDTFQRDWAARHPGSTLTPLFGQIYEPSNKEELAFVATGGGQDRYGFVTSSEAGPDFLVDGPLLPASRSLAFALPGDEVGRLLVVAAPGAELAYSKTGNQPFEPMTSVADGVAVHPLDGQPAVDRYQVTHASGPGDVQYAPNVGTTSSDTPANVLADWPQRGDAADQAAERALVTRFAAAFSRSADTAKYRSLFNGHTASGLRYTVGQAWFTGETTAYTVSYATGGTNGPEFFLGRATDTTPVVVAAVLCCAPGATTDTLVVVPQPKTGQVEYTPTDPGGYSPAQAVAGGNGVYVIDRSRTPAGDRIRVLDGDGKLDHPTFEGPVGPLLCGYNSCG